MAADASWAREHIRDIADYPRPGVTFRDITPLLGNPAAFGRAVDDLVEWVPRCRASTRWSASRPGASSSPRRSPTACGAGFVPVRKAGKLPWAVAREEYELEYGTDKLEIHRDAIHPRERILVVDDVLATGGTASATGRLIETLGGVIVGFGFLIELADPPRPRPLRRAPVESLIAY